MTDARLGGLGREALVADAGELRLGGVVREALVAGVGLGATVTAQSAASGAGSVLSAGLVLSGSIKTTVSQVAGRLSLHVNLAAQIDAASAVRGGFITTRVLSGQITAQSKIQLAPLGLTVLQARITATSDAEAFAIVLAIRTKQGAVTINSS